MTERAVNQTIHVYAWGNNPRRSSLRGRKCRVVVHGALQSSASSSSSTTGSAKSFRDERCGAHCRKCVNQPLQRLVEWTSCSDVGNHFRLRNRSAVTVDRPGFRERASGHVGCTAPSSVAREPSPLFPEAHLTTGGARVNPSALREDPRAGEAGATDSRSGRATAFLSSRALDWVWWPRCGPIVAGHEDVLDTYRQASIYSRASI